MRAQAPPAAVAGQIMPEFEAMGQQMDDLLARYDDAELALIRDFLERSNAIATARIAALGGGPAPREAHANSSARG